MPRRFRTLIPILCGLACLALVLGFASAALAAGEEGSFFSQVGGKLGEGANIVIGAILSVWTLFAGGLLILFTKGLLFVAQFNQFVNSEAVNLGWKIVRDICNMFFVLILLIIAIGTILQQEKYHYSKLLPQFIAMAIMINFSKTICGVLIDAAQVVMLTFVGAFSGAAGGNLFALLGMHQLWTIVGNNADKKAHEGALLGTFLLVAVFVTIADVVVFVMLMVLIARIVMLWFLIVLSPFAFILSILPGAAQKYAGQWWSEFTNYVIVGPAMAFFLWLSLAVVASNPGDRADITKYNPGASQLSDKESKQFTDLEEGFKEKPADVGSTAIGTLSGMLNYVLGIGMLMGTLMVAQQLGVAGGKMAGAAVGGINDVLSGKKGLVPWRSMMGTAWSTFEGKQMDVWKKRGERLGNVGARLADSTIGKLAPTKAGRAEAQTRIEAHKEETTKRKMDNFAKAGDFAKLSPQELRSQLAKEKNGMRRAALINALNKSGELGNEKGDTDLIAAQAKFLHQNGGAQMQVEFDDQIKKANLTAAFQAGRFNDEHGNLSVDKFFAELKSGKFSSESVTDDMLKKLGSKNDADAEAAIAQKQAQLVKDLKSKDPKKHEEAQAQLDEMKKQDEKRDAAQKKQEAAKTAAKDIRVHAETEKEVRRKRIQEIKDTAKRDNRELTKAEKAEVQALNAQIGKIDRTAEAQAGTHDRELSKQKNEEKKAKAAQFEMAGQKLLGNRLVEGMKDAKQIGSVVSNLSTNTWRELEQNTSLLQGVTDEQRIAFARAKGAYELAFDTDTDLDHNSEGGMQNRARAQELFAKKDRTSVENQELDRLQNAEKQQDLFRSQILSKGDKRDEFYKIIDKQSAANKNIWKIVSENNDWKAAYAQRVALYRDAEKKDAIRASVGELVDDYNMKGDEKGEADTIRNVRMRNLLHGATRQNQYVSADGRVKDIYDARGESYADELLRSKYHRSEAEIAGMSWKDKTTALKDDMAEVNEVAENARKSYGIQISHDRLQADELEDQDWSSESGSSDESMEMFEDAYTSEQGRKIVGVNKELMRKQLEFRHREGSSGYFEKKVKAFSDQLAAAEGDEKNMIRKKYQDWKSGHLSKSQRMNKGDNTYTNLPTISVEETTARLNALEERYDLKATTPPPTGGSVAPAAVAPAAVAPAQARQNQKYVTGKDVPESVTRGGVVINPGGGTQQSSRPAQQAPQSQPPEDESGIFD